MSTYAIRKYMGDDLYSWALFRDGRPIMTGMDRTEARWRLDVARKGENPTKSAPVPRQRVGPCPCECNRGGFCGGCGHAGCGGR